MERIPEPELMDEAEQAKAYAEADFEAPNSLFVEEYARRFPGALEGRVLDLGCGPGDISLRFAERHPGCRVTAVDGAEVMLDWGRRALVEQAACQGRVEFVLGRLPSLELAEGPYAAIISNSLLHHLHDPQALWSVVRRYGGPGTAVLVMDLMRPDSQQAARALVEQYAAGEPAVLRRDFYNSLLAAFTPDEVEAQLQVAGLGGLAVEVVSDRHLLIAGRMT